MDVSYRYSPAVLDGRKAILQENGTVEFVTDEPEVTEPEVTEPEVTETEVIEAEVIEAVAKPVKKSK